MTAALQARPFEQGLALAGPVLGHAAVVVEMVLGEIGEHRHVRISVPSRRASASPMEDASMAHAPNP
jgi:uncharacterized protein (DUF2342 family)